MIYVSVKKTSPMTDGETQKKALSFRILRYGENTAFIDSILSRKNSTSRQNSIQAYALLDTMLLSLTDVKTAVLARGKNGKPNLENENITFNISHTEGAVACIIDTEGGSVGIDVERVNRDGCDIIDRFFDDVAREKHADAADKPLSFAEIWTEKEAYSKFLGTGISDYKTDYPLPHLFTHFRSDQFFITACTLPSAQVQICQNDEDWRKG